MATPGGKRPTPLIFRTFGVDLNRARFAMAARTHQLTARQLGKLSPDEIYNAHRGLVMAALQPDCTKDDFKLACVKMQRLMLELTERLMQAAGVRVIVSVDPEEKVIREE